MGERRDQCGGRRARSRVAAAENAARAKIDWDTAAVVIYARKIVGNRARDA